MTRLLEVSDLSVSYGPIVAVRKVSFWVSSGETLAIIGPNGAGKSTILNAIMGLRNITNGSIQFNGDPITRRSPEDILRMGISLVPERRRIFTRLSVQENLQLGALTRRRGGGIRSDMEPVFELFPVLASRLSDSAGLLSGGQQQQLAIARALLAHPRLLLLDEPSLGLAPLMIRSVFDVLGSLQKSGTTLLLVEQLATQAIRLADRVLVLRNGAIVLETSKDNISDLESFTEAYLGV